MSWAAIAAGTVSALGMWILLYTLGVALGLSNVTPGDRGSVDTAATIGGIWGLVAPLVALFIGGFVAGRVAGPVTKLTGSLHGLAMWGITAIGGVWIVSMLVGTVATGAAQGIGAVASTVGDNISINSTDALGPVNARLQEAGQPVITPEQFRAATNDVVAQAVREGRVDQAMVVTALDQQTSLSRADAEAVANRVVAQYEAARSRASYEAMVAAEKTGAAMWALFAALLAGLVASMAGALLAVTRVQRDRAEVPIAVDPAMRPATRNEAVVIR
ncbi:MAG: hypothetical protein U1F43_32090 [Myxococcota bacterium]